MARRDHQHDREDPHRTGLPIDPYDPFCSHSTSGAQNVRTQENSRLGLEIPMAVTAARNEIALGCGHREAHPGGDIAGVIELMAQSARIP